MHFDQVNELREQISVIHAMASENGHTSDFIQTRWMLRALKSLDTKVHQLINQLDDHLNLALRDDEMAFRDLVSDNKRLRHDYGDDVVELRGFIDKCLLYNASREPGIEVVLSAGSLIASDDHGVVMAELAVADPTAAEGWLKKVKEALE